MKIAIASFGFSLGSAVAAALFAGQAGERAQPARPVAVAAAAPAPASAATRIVFTAAEQHEARALGLTDRPIRSILNVRGKMNYGDYRWDDAGVPAGPTWVRVDLDTQLMSVFRAGHEIGTAVILYGADGVPTPTGHFPILAKLKDHQSSTYDGAPMPYTLRLTGDGVSIHGSNVRWGFATHGCVGVPTAFAAKLFDAVKKGDEVLIVNSAARKSAA
jgi:lipoprotein-anchoring transpeptidase ErfK/SrfK